MRVVYDTSILVEGLDEPVENAALSVMTLAELEIGVLLAGDADKRQRRMSSFVSLRRAMQALPVDDRVASAYALLIAKSRDVGRNPRVVDTIIAATALANDRTLVTRDAHQAAIPGVASVLVR